MKRAADTVEGGPAATLDATIERWFTPEFRAAQPDYISKVRQWVLANDPGIYAQCRQVLATGVIELIDPQPPITLPTLVMTAEYDSGSSSGHESCYHQRDSRCSHSHRTGLEAHGAGRATGAICRSFAPASRRGANLTPSRDGRGGERRAQLQ